MPASSIAMLLGFAFLVFSAFAALQLIPDLKRFPAWYAAVLILGQGGCAMLYAFVAVRSRWKLIPLIFAAQFAGVALLKRAVKMNGIYSLDQDLHSRIGNLAGVAMICTIAAYVLALAIFSREGRRYHLMAAEMQLASDIHKSLVPRIEERIGDFEFFGFSLPSGEVGGDLVDLVRVDGMWMAYLADVSGHGVPSGVLMAMLKSATRMVVRQEDSLAKMLAGINEVFHSLKSPSAFATFAGICHTRERGLEVAVAGHYPVVLCSDHRAAELDTPGLPLGMMDHGGYASRSFEMRTGDLLVLVTDGLVEVFDKAEQELGSEYVTRVALEHRASPLAMIAQKIVAEAERFGKRCDDQSLLLIRRN